jgi:uncharacterized protein with HEPN domain
VKDDRLYLGHILEAVERITLFGQDGEVSVETRAAHPDIPWKDIAGIRDRVVHDYFGVSLDIVWDVVQNHVPPLRERLRQALGT